MPKSQVDWDEIGDRIERGKINSANREREQQRFELVKAALTGLLANPSINAHTDYLATMAIRQADATLAELEKNQI